MTITPTQQVQILTRAAENGLSGPTIVTLARLCDHANREGTNDLHMNARMIEGADKNQLARLARAGLITYQPRRGHGVRYPLSIVLPETE